jgi:hypothetical protein
VVKHLAFQKHAHLDQSLFTRFVRLGVPPVLLDKQGRARPEIAALYSWRYTSLVATTAEKEVVMVPTSSAPQSTQKVKRSHTGSVASIASAATAESTASTMALMPPPKGLGNLPNVTSQPAYLTANAGFVHTFQLVDVPEFQGKGEFCPTPYFYQNLGEAEYVVAVFQYMRLIGYPAEKITILTTYNGQKHLIRDVIAQRCRSPLFGRPAIVTTGRN